MVFKPSPEEQHLTARLCALKPSGPEGFEGFVRDCLEEALGMRFRLMKSGHQHGADVVRFAANGLHVAVEGKRYGATSLGLDQLEAKLGDAARSHPALDLWVLATTKPISGGDEASLKAKGDESGVAVALLDARDSPGAPSALATLCALAPRSCELHNVLDAEAAHYIAAVRDDPGFDTWAESTLEPFKSRDVGFAAARAACRSWLEAAFADRRSAKARLQCHGDIGAAGAGVVRRTGSFAALDQWWGAGAATPLALIGQEGVGKTWAVFDWLRTRWSQDPESLPVTLVIPARDVAGESGPELIARVIADRIGIRSSDFWERRLELWNQDRDRAPKILVIIDGLNQKPDFLAWSRLAQPLLANEWRDQVGILLTCRTGFWNHDLKGLVDLTPAPASFEVTPFDDAEVDTYLRERNLSIDDFGPEFRGLLRIPRYCQLAVERRAALEASGDITVERLIYEDWKHRHSLYGAGLAPTDAEFLRYIAEQGQRMRSALPVGGEVSVTRRTIVDDLSRISGRDEGQLQTSLSEIVDSTWIESVPGANSEFRLKQDMSVFALGLALLGELRGQSDKRERLASFLEPMRGADLGVAILRAAFSVALLEDADNDLATLLLNEWFTAQNFSNAEARTLERLMPHRPALFLDYAEQVWLGPRYGVHDETWFIPAFAEAAHWQGFGAALKTRLGQWLGLYWVEPLRVRHNDARDSAEAAERTAGVEARATAWIAASASTSWASLPLRFVALDEEDYLQDWPKLASRAVAILSFLPRAAFPDLYAGWAVSRAIRGADRNQDAMGWVLRENPVDGTASVAMIERLASELLALDCAVGDTAADLLVGALALPAVADRLGRVLDAPRSFRERTRLAADGTVCWDTARDRERDLSAYGPLLDLAWRPEVGLRPQDRAALIAAAEKLDVNELFSGERSRTEADFNLEQGRGALARWAPEELARLVRRAFLTADKRRWPVPKPEPVRSWLPKWASAVIARFRPPVPSTEEPSRDEAFGLALALPAYLPLLDRAALGSVRNLAHKKREAMFGEKADQWLNLQMARLWNLPAAEQIELFRGDPDGPQFFEDHHHVLAPLSASDINSLTADLTGPNGAGWLGYITNAKRDGFPEGFQPLVDAVSSADPRTRARALFMLRQTKDQAILHGLAASSWRWTPDMDRGESAQGSLALVNAARHIDVPNFADRIDPQAWGAVLADSPDDGGAFQQFRAYVLEEIARCSAENGMVDIRGWLNQKDAMAIIAARDPQALISALDNMIATDPYNAFSFDSFPIIDSLRALINAVPDEGARLWQALWPSYRDSSWTLEKFEELPFVSTDSAFLPLREEVLKNAMNDAALANIVAWAIDGGAEHWLLERLESFLLGDTAGSIARGLTLARFLDASDGARSLWECLLRDNPSGWLATVRRLASENFARTTSAVHWLDAFFAEADCDRAFGHLVLFRLCAGKRDIVLAERRMEERWDTLDGEKQAIWYAFDDELERVSKESNKDRDKRLYGEDIPKQTHAPWRGNPVLPQ